MRLHPTCLVLALACSLASLRGQDDQEALLPSSRKMAAVADQERNPYANVEKPKVEVASDVPDAKSEEGRIEAVLESLAVVGRTRGPSGWKVLLGDLILEAGKPLPPVIAGQTQVLRVAAIYDSMIEIEWAKKDPKDAQEVSKRIFIVVKLNPTVGLALSGQKSSQKAAEPMVVTEPQDTPPPPDALSPAK